MKFPRDRISASLYNCYKDCPYSFKLTVIDELLAPEGPALEIGSILDFMFKTFHQEKDWLKSAQKEYLDKKVNKDRIKNFGIARELMETYLKEPNKFTNFKPDIEFNVPITNIKTGETIEGITFKGYLDGKELNPLRIKELKSSKDPYTQEQIDNSFQATSYVYGSYMEHKELLPVDYTVICKNVKAKNRVQKLTTTRNLDDLVKWFEDIKQFIKNVEDEKFDRNPNHPFYCNCRKIG